MSTPFDVRRWAEQAGIHTTGGFSVVAECVTLDELQRFADIAIATAAIAKAEGTAMTKILIDRATVEQALEALEAGPDVDPIFAGETEDALRAALAQPVQEPVGAVLVNRESREGVMFYSVDMIPDPSTLKDRFELVPVYTAPPQRPAEPEQESVSAERLFTLAHLWAQQTYFKGLGRPCDIDGARAAFENGLKALTQQTEPVQEPVAWSVLDKRTKKHWYTNESKYTAQHYANECSHSQPDGSPSMVVTPLYTHPPRRVPEQEPVAWRTFDGEGGYDYRSYEMNEDYDEWWEHRHPNHKGWVEALYTAPPQRKPLTENQIRFAFRKSFPVGSVLFNGDAVSFARAVEAAHGIKENT